MESTENRNALATDWLDRLYYTPARHWHRRMARHKRWTMGFMGLLAAHWIEHVVQAWQVYDLCVPRAKAYGLVGGWFPYLITGEWLHFAFALFTLVGLLLLRYGFLGKAQAWWNLAIAVGIWHLGEHFLLFGQAQNWFTFFGHGHDNPTSVVQLAIPMRRMEIHIFYNSLISIPIGLAMWLERRFWNA